MPMDTYSYEAMLRDLAEGSTATKQLADELRSIITPQNCLGFISKVVNPDAWKSGSLDSFSEHHFIHCTYEFRHSPPSGYANLDVYPISEGRITSVQLGSIDRNKLSFANREVELQFGERQSLTISLGNSLYLQTPQTVDQFYESLKTELLKH